MALFGDRCSRCGRRTRHTYENLPTCEACERDIKTRLEADAEEKRPCPLDRATMEKEVVGDIVIDRCPTCKGVWLDGGELEQIRRSAELGAAKEVLRGMAYPL